VADIKSESWPASDRNTWPTSDWNAWPASSESALEDRYRTVLVEKLKEKQAELPVRMEPHAPTRQNVVDLMAALQWSLSAERKTAPKPVPRAAAASVRASPTKRSTGRGR
jgi:hypothetical protein